MRISGLVLALWVGAACTGAEAPPPRTPASDSVQPAEGNSAGRVYERNLVFTAPAADTTLSVLWLFSARTRPGGVDRSTRALLLRGSTWEPFHEAVWTTPPTRVPWRILPHGSLRLVVGEEDALATVLYSEGTRALELGLSDVLAEWTSGSGHAVRLLEADLVMSGRRVDGVVMELARTAAEASQELGDWAFLVSGDSLQVSLEGAAGGDPAGPRPYRAWGRLDLRNLTWPPVSVEWAETRAFQPARRDVPTSWTLTSPDGGIDGVLEVEAAEIRAQEGPGPLLPVDALFSVRGSLVVEGRAFPVRGIVRHERR